MEKTYEVLINPTGNPYASGVLFCVHAESKEDAIRIAKEKYPDRVIASIKEK